MKQTHNLVLGLVLAACSHNERPAEPSASSVDQATNVPSNTDFTPPENRVGDTVAETPGTGTTSPVAPMTADSAPNSTNPSALTPASGPTMAPVNSNPPAANPPSGTQPDNTAVNKRDRGDSTLTPMDQGGSEGDRKITQQIRQAVVGDGSLSFSAKNVKVITVNGKVTLRGTVNTSDERAAVERAAVKVAGAGRVDNQLEVSK